MKYYSTYQRVEISAMLINKARLFANAVVPTTNYADSKQFSEDKIREDHFISKIGEEAARIVLSAFGTVKGPDYNVYEANQKTWDDDLYLNNIGIAVKTQKRTAAVQFGLSWTFQSGPTRRDIILSKPDGWVIFVLFNDQVGNVCFVYPPYQIKELTFGEPMLDKLKGYKKVVYGKTLPKGPGDTR